MQKETKRNRNYKGPLQELNVIDFGWYYAGAMAGMLLAEQGANVIRIIKPGNRELPDQQYRLLNRNKNILELDLKTEEGKAQAITLIQKADVLIENFRPGVMKRLGLDYSSIKEENPSLIYLSLPGFASTDKDRAQIQAWEGLLGAASGLYTDTSPVRKLLNYPPVYTWVPQCSMYGAVHGAIAIMSALLARKEHGWGVSIEVPLVDAGLSGFGGYDFWGAPGYPAPIRKVDENGICLGHSIPENQMSNTYSADDDKSVQQQKISRGMRTMFSSAIYSCADGREILIWAYTNEKFFKALGLEKQLKQEGFVFDSPWAVALGNNICARCAGSPEHQQRLKEVLKETFKLKPAEYWERFLGEVAAVGVIRTREEWLAIKPLLDSGVFCEMDNGLSKLTVTGRLADINSAGDAGNEDVLINEPVSVTMADACTLFSSCPPLLNLKDRKPSQRKSEFLKGLKVLDMANVVAGPAATLILEQYGAEVIKLDSPNMLVASAAPTLALEVGQGKKSLLVDLKTAPGREVFERLVKWADVVTHNNLDDVSWRLGVSQSQLENIKPEIVSAQFSAFGGSRRGGWELHNGWDILLQAVSGLMAEYGTLKEPHLHGLISAADYLGGAIFAFTTLLGVWQQRTTGQTCEARTSLARAVNAVQFPYMIAENGKSDWGEPRGQSAQGGHAWQRLYQCSDGWLYVGVAEERAASLAKAVTEQSVIDVSALESAFADKSCAYWLNLLRKADIACHKVMSINDICRAGHFNRVMNEEREKIIEDSYEISCWDDHPSGHAIVLKAPTWVRVGEKPSYKQLLPAPIFGQHSKVLLTEFGYNDMEINNLIRLGVVHEYQPGMGGKEAYFFKPGKQ